jgi:hypothetical protein
MERLERVVELVVKAMVGGEESQEALEHPAMVAVVVLEETEARTKQVVVLVGKEMVVVVVHVLDFLYPHLLAVMVEVYLVDLVVVEVVTHLRLVVAEATAVVVVVDGALALNTMVLEVEVVVLIFQDRINPMFLDTMLTTDMYQLT